MTKKAPLACTGKSPFYRPIPRKTPPEIIEKILELRREYQIGALRIKYYLERYHGINISESTVSRTLKAHGVGKLPKTDPRRALHTKRYANTAIDDATRIRALQVFPKHNQDYAINTLELKYS